MALVSLWGQHHCSRENLFMWSSNCFCRHPCRLGRWNKLNDRSNFFAIASVETVQLQSDKRMALKSSAAQSYEASSPKQRASGREFSLCLLLSPNSTNSERNICSIRKRDWQTTVKLVVGTFQVPLSTTTNKKQTSKTSQARLHSRASLRCSRNLTFTHTSSPLNFLAVRAFHCHPLTPCTSTDLSPHPRDPTANMRNQELNLLKANGCLVTPFDDVETPAQRGAGEAEALKFPSESRTKRSH